MSNSGDGSSVETKKGSAKEAYDRRRAEKKKPAANPLVPIEKPGDDVQAEDVKTTVQEATPDAEEVTTVALRTMVNRDEAMVESFRGLIPSTIGEAILLAGHLGRSSAVPTSSRSPENALAIIMAGVELGLSPMRAMQSIINIKGNLAMKADLQLALVRRSGTLEYFDEGFEFKGKTDKSLGQRKAAAGDPFGADLILSLVEDVPEGKPYGWCTVRRRGDRQRHTRVFSWSDAERFVYNARDDDEEGGGSKGQRVEKKLSEKANYKNSPQDMYPKRARVRVLQVTHSDILAGLPAVEALEGVAVDVEIVDRPTSTEDQIAIELTVLDRTHQAESKSIRAGFSQLDLGSAKRLQLLRQFKDRPGDLLQWLKTEYAKRHGRPGIRPHDTLDLVPSEQQQQPKELSGPVAKQKEEPTETSLSELAQRFTGIEGESF